LEMTCPVCRQPLERQDAFAHGELLKQDQMLQQLSRIISDDDLYQTCIRCGRLPPDSHDDEYRERVQEQVEKLRNLDPGEAKQNSELMREYYRDMEYFLKRNFRK